MHLRLHHASSAAIALVFVLVLAVPAWAAKPGGVGGGSNGSGANGGGNAGSVKVVDLESGQEPVTENEPHVCAFYLLFDGAPSGESGAWSLVDWPPTGSGDLVEDGAYDIPANGSYQTETFELDAGHYRVNWQAVNTQTEKHKVFWVDEGCVADDPVDQPDEPEEQPEDEALDETQEQPEDEALDETQEQPEEQHETDPEGDIAPATDGQPIVDELPDSAMPAPVLPGLGVALGLVLLIIGHRALRDRA